jgi:hypothetical protein
MLAGDLVEGCAVQQSVQGTSEVGAVAGGVLGGAGEGVAEEGSGVAGPTDQRVERRDLLGHRGVPPLARTVQNSGRGVQGDAEALRDLDEGQPTQFRPPVHALPPHPARRTDQAALLVVTQRGGAHPQPPGRRTDGYLFHPSI